ncbi:FAD-dependent oxidoreductase, partial [Sinorhizobium sp. CCBAU 05631]|uniref:FAD-dependent oxidoreductase n=1 Tax=Sinorhizobium sp. CCBAU 05631 TaxID=794846 RepID=UPI00055D41AA
PTRHWLQPKRVAVKDGKVAGIELEYTALEEGKLTTTGETGIIAAEQIFKAIGQSFQASGLGALQMESGRIVVDAEGRTSFARVWAGGDCVLGGEDLTVSAVAMGRDSAESINRAFAADAPLASAVA